MDQVADCWNNIGDFYKKIIHKIGWFLRIENKLIRCFLAEFLGTFVFLYFALASVAQYVISGNTYLAMNISFGFGLSMGIIISGNISGGHLNPAVSFAFLLKGKLSLVRFFFYVIAQNLGAFLAAVMVYLTYLYELTIYEEGMYSLKTAGMFATFPRNESRPMYISLQTFSDCWDQLFATAFFILAILAITDKNNSKLPNAINAILIGCCLIIVGTSFGINCGFAVNPARDFAPRLFTLIAGWGWKVFYANNYFFWIPLIMPMFGAVLAVCLYHLFIANHWPENESDKYDE